MLARPRVPRAVAVRVAAPPARTGGGARARPAPSGAGADHRALPLAVRVPPQRGLLSRLRPVVHRDERRVRADHGVRRRPAARDDLLRPARPRLRRATTEAGVRASAGPSAAAARGSVVHADGHLVELAVTGLPIVVDDVVVGVYGIAEDITEAKRLRAGAGPPPRGGGAGQRGEVAVPGEREPRDPEPAQQPPRHHELLRDTGLDDGQWASSTRWTAPVSGCSAWSTRSWSSPVSRWARAVATRCPSTYACSSVRSRP